MISYTLFLLSMKRLTWHPFNISVAHLSLWDSYGSTIWDTLHFIHAVQVSRSSYATASVLSLGHYGFRGGASLQIENAQLKLHFSSCMLVLSFE